MNKPARSEDWLLDLIAEGEDQNCHSAHESASFLTEGRRNADLASFAGFLRRKYNLNEADLATFLGSLNSASASPVSKAEVALVVKSIARYDTEQALEFDDTHLSRELAQHLVNRFCFTPAMGWMRFHEGRWTPEGSSQHVQEAVKRFVEMLYESVKAGGRGNDHPLVKAAKRFLAKSKITGLADLASTDPLLLRSTEDFDAMSGLLNLRNGTIEMHASGIVFREHRAEDMLTQIADVEYVPEAGCPTFDRVLSRALATEEAAFFLRFNGYILTGNFDQQVMGIFYGSGANGKSTLVNEIQALLGTYAATVETNTFMIQKQASIRNDLARLRGVRLAVSTELGTGEILDASLMKKLTGGDKITARYLHKEFFEFTPSAVPLFVTNSLPVIDGGDAAIVRRLVALQFGNVIPPHERDPTLPNKLKAERSGILNRLLEGLLDYLSDQKLRRPESVKQATGDYAGASDLLGQFIEDEAVLGPERTVGAQELYAAYKYWCFQSGVKPLSMPQFKPELSKRRGLSNARAKVGMVWSGLTLKAGPR